MMQLQFISMFVLTVLATMISAQNLIPDGGFENIMGCDQPELNISKSVNWYSLEATPDLFIGDCNFDEAGNFFWDASLKAIEGKNFAGLAGRWNSNETYISEGIATRLITPLESGKTYFLSMYIKNQGGYQGLADLTNCVLRPEKHLDIYLSNDSIYLENNFSNGTASSSGLLTSVIAPDEVKSTIIGSWTQVTTCFIAEGSEQYLAIQMPLGTFGDLPPCASQASSGVFRSFYYYLDDVQLTALTTTIESEITLCSGESLEVNLRELFESSTSDESIFFWQDGYEGSTRYLSVSGQYLINANVACGTIPLLLDVKEENCSVLYYAPTVFSPNNDGINDHFQLFFNHFTKPRTFKLMIYDHWGNLVFQSDNTTNPWNGIVNGQAAPSGTYLWMAIFDLQNTSGMRKFSEGGSITILK